MSLFRLTAAMFVAILVGYFLLGGNPSATTTYAVDHEEGYAQGAVSVQYAGHHIDLSAEHPGSDGDEVTPDKPKTCSSCGGTGKVGDGRVFVECRACGGDGVAAVNTGHVSTPPRSKWVRKYGKYWADHGDGVLREVVSPWRTMEQYLADESGPDIFGKNVSYDTKSSETGHVRVAMLTSQDCVYCPGMRKIVDRLYADGVDCMIYDIDLVPNQSAALGYGASLGNSLPQVLVYRDDKLVKQFIGTTSESTVREAVGLTPIAARTETMIDPSDYPEMSCSGGVFVKQYQPAMTVKPQKRWTVYKSSRACVGCR